MADDVWRGLDAELSREDRLDWLCDDLRFSCAHGSIVVRVDARHLVDRPTLLIEKAATLIACVRSTAGCECGEDILARYVRPALAGL